jgi:hypothetical protein
VQVQHESHAALDLLGLAVRTGGGIPPSDHTTREVAEMAVK